MDSRITFSKKHKLNILLIIALGALLSIAGYFTQESDAAGWWANMLLDGYFFLAIAGGAAFFIAAHSIANSGWHTSLQRIPEAMATYLPIGGLLMLLVLPGIHSIYHWSHPEGDALLEAKTAWLNVPFFIIRSIIYVSLWSFLFMLIRRTSLAMDDNDDLIYFNKLKRYSAIFIIGFVFTFYIASWDWLMSLDPHWFSTIYGFYIIAGMLSASVAMIILMVALFKWLGYFKHVNVEHIHDLGKYLFGFSIFWGYLWGSQFLLIWFSNIPEEGVYYVERLSHHSGLFIATGIINFVLPTLLLMTNGAKRNIFWLGSIALIVLIGQWLNYYLTIMPGAIHSEVSIGFREIGMVVLYFGVFCMSFLHRLQKPIKYLQNIRFLKRALNMKIYCNLNKVRHFQLIVVAFMLGGVFVSCDFDRNKPGYSYFPDMEQSQAYETYSNSTVFADGKTNQMPNANTIARGKMPYHFEKTEENLALAGVELINPLPNDSVVLKEGKRLFQIYCMQCHGDKGDGKGYLYVSGKYPYPPSSLLSERSRNRKDGELFHIISVGFGVMGAHQSIINPDERWMIVAYINKLQ